MAEGVDRVLTLAEAQTMQDQGHAAAWIVTGNDARHPGKLVARPHTCAHDGGRFLPCVLVADNLVQLRAMLPTGATRRGELALFGPDILELWN
jgi:hypothetical protein